MCTPVTGHASRSSEESSLTGDVTSEGGGVVLRPSVVSGMDAATAK